MPEIFDEALDRYASQRAQLIALLGPHGYAAARRSTINAHYTHPLIVDAMWQFAHRLGFSGGRVLEPGCGPGVFIGRAPDGVHVTGVELDPTTAAIAQALYPDATICATSFADARGLGDATFDLVIGNVPFGDMALYDPVHNAGGHSIHNHFLIKSLALLRPGGLLVALTSRFTLDSQRDGARREMHQMADLVAAVRLPAGAHSRVAGTEALTDLLVMRRRAPEQALPRAEWLDSVAVSIDGEQVHANAYFVAHPSHIAGTLAVDTGPYCRDLTVQGDTSAADGRRRDLGGSRQPGPPRGHHGRGAGCGGPRPASRRPPHRSSTSVTGGTATSWRCRAGASASWSTARPSRSRSPRTPRRRCGCC